MTGATEQIKSFFCRTEKRFRQLIADTPFRRLRNYMVVVYGAITLAAGIAGIIAINLIVVLVLLLLDKLI